MVTQPLLQWSFPCTCLTPNLLVPTFNVCKSVYQTWLNISNPTWFIYLCFKLNSQVHDTRLCGMKRSRFIQLHIEWLYNYLRRDLHAIKPCRYMCIRLLVLFWEVIATIFIPGKHNIERQIGCWVIDHRWAEVFKTDW